MTDLRRRVKRRTVSPFDYQRRRIVVYLLPGDVIAMREEGRRKLFQAEISKVFRQIVKWNAEAERSKKRRRRSK